MVARVKRGSSACSPFVCHWPRQCACKPDVAIATTSINQFVRFSCATGPASALANPMLQLQRRPSISLFAVRVPLALPVRLQTRCCNCNDVHQSVCSLFVCHWPCQCECKTDVVCVTTFANQL